MNWDDARIFLAVARAGQILGAARRLDLNHATVSRRIASLEQALGAKLFSRTTTGSDLTAAGRRFLAVAERMEAETIEALAQVANEDEALAGTVRIGAPDGFGVAFLAPRLGAFAEMHPQLRIELVPVPRSFSLSRREADIAITTERPTEGRLVAGKLVDYTLGLFASRGYVARNGLPASRAQLAEHSLVGYVPDLVASASLDYAAAFGSDWAPRFTISSALGQAEAVRAGAGIGIVHTFIARAMPELVPVEVVEPIRRAYWLVCHEQMRTLTRIRAVTGFIGVVFDERRADFA